MTVYDFSESMDMAESDTWAGGMGYNGERQWDGAWSVLLPPSLHYFQTYPIAAAPYIPALVNTKKLEQHPEIPELANAHVCYPTHVPLHSAPIAEETGMTETVTSVTIILFGIPPSIWFMTHLWPSFLSVLSSSMFITP